MLSGKRVTDRQETSASACSNINRLDVVGTCCYCVGSTCPARAWLGSGLFGQAAPCGPFCQNVDIASSGIREYPVAIFLFKGTVFFLTQPAIFVSISFLLCFLHSLPTPSIFPSWVYVLLLILGSTTVSNKGSWCCSESVPQPIKTSGIPGWVHRPVTQP